MMKKQRLKISSIKQRGVRGGETLQDVIQSLRLHHDNDNGNDNNHHEDTSNNNYHTADDVVIVPVPAPIPDPAAAAAAAVVVVSPLLPPPQKMYDELVIDRINFGKCDIATNMAKVIKSQPTWKRIYFLKSNGKFINIVLQAVVERSATFEIMQHYDSVKWTFPLDFHIPTTITNNSSSSNSSTLESIQFKGCKFRHKPQTIISISEALENQCEHPTLGIDNDNDNDNETITKTTKTKTTSSSSSSAVIRAINFVSCRFVHPEGLPAVITGVRNNQLLHRLWMPHCELSDEQIVVLIHALIAANNSNLRELGLSYNRCGIPGSQAIAALIKKDYLRTLYVNRQQNEMDLFVLLQSFNTTTVLQDFNLSHNYVPAHKIQDLLNSITPPTKAQYVDLRRLDKPLPWVSLDQHLQPCHPNSQQARVHQNNNNNNNNSDNNPQGGASGSRFPPSFLSTITKEEVAILNTACARIKQMLTQQSSFKNKIDPQQQQQQQNINDGGDDDDDDDKTRNGNDIVAAVQNNNDEDNNDEDNTTTTNNNHNIIINDLITIIRLANKHEHENGAIWIPKFLRKAVDRDISILRSLFENNDISNSKTTTANSIITEAETRQLIGIWDAIQEIDSIYRREKKERKEKNYVKSGSKKEKKIKQLLAVTDSPLLQEAYNHASTTTTSLVVNSLENNNSQEPFLFLPQPPQFVDTTADIESIKYNIINGNAPLVGLDSEWYFVYDDDDDDNDDSKRENSTKKNHKNGNDKRKKILSIATLQVAFYNGTTSSNDNDENDNCHNNNIIQVFVIDLLSRKPGFQIAAKTFISWLFSGTSTFLLLGFAFGGDIQKLQEYVTSSSSSSNSNDTSTGASTTTTSTTSSVTEEKEEHNSNNQKNRNNILSSKRCLDIQQLFCTMFPSYIQNGHVPGLKKCTETYFKKPLSKVEQCSDWSQRPLSKSQLYYAGLDASILLYLLSEKKKETQEKIIQEE